MKKLFFPVPGLLVLLIILGLSSNPIPARDHNLEELIITNSVGLSVSYNIEIARTSAQMQRGLMFRDSMPENQGMLFIYLPERPASMWMKNTILPLDMFFIDRHGIIINIAEDTIPFSTEPIRSDGDVRAVLELNAGQARKHQIATGDKVTHPLFE